jgi:hypothetical protein
MTREPVMTHEQAALVVTYLNRAGMIQAMEGQAAVWRDALYGVCYEDAIEACRELVRRAGVVQVKPGDLLAEVRLIRRARIGNRVAPAPPVELPPARDAQFCRAFLRALGDGADEDQADAQACRAVGVVRGELPEADPGRLAALMAASVRGVA